MKPRILAVRPGLLLTVLACGLVLLAGCGGQEAKSSGITTPSGGASADLIAVKIAENDDGFDPKAVTVRRDQLVLLTFVNEGKAMHNLRIAGPSGEFGGPGDTVLGEPLVMPGQSVTREWRAPGRQAQLKFRCDLHPDHTGIISVR